MPIWRHGPAYLQAEVFPDPDDPPTGWSRFEIVVGGQLLVLDGTMVALKWATASTGHDAAHMGAAPPPSTPATSRDERRVRLIDTPQGVLAIRKASYLSMDHFVGEGALVRAVYRLLDDDFQELFGRELWSSR